MIARCLAAGAFLVYLLFLSFQPTIGASLDAPFLESSLSEPSLPGNGTSPAARHLEFCPATVSTTECAAEFLALEHSEALLPPPQLYEQILNDLTAIRAVYPDMNLLNHLPRWFVGRLTVMLTEAAWDAYINGTDPFIPLGEPYRPTTVTQGLDRTLFLEFAQRYNPEPLATMYMALDSISEASPDGLVGDASTIRAAPPIYRFDLKWGGCAAGCIHKYTWEYAVSGGMVRPMNPERAAILEPDTSTELRTQDAITLTFASNSVTHTTIVTATANFTPTLAMNDFIFIGQGVRTGMLDAADAVLADADARQAADASSVNNLSPSFQQPYTMTITYDDADWQQRGVSNESVLNVYAMGKGDWEALLPCGGCTIDTEANTITLQTNQITDFALMRRVRWSLHLPMVSRTATTH